MENRRVCIQSRVDEANRRFTSLEPRVVDTGQNGCKSWRAGGGAANQSWGAVVEDDDVVTDSSDVWVSAADAVILASVGTDVLSIGGAVVLVFRFGSGEVGCNGTLLVPLI